LFPLNPRDLSYLFRLLFLLFPLNPWDLSYLFRLLFPLHLYFRSDLFHPYHPLYLSIRLIPSVQLYQLFPLILLILSDHRYRPHRQFRFHPSHLWVLRFLLNRSIR
jgi:hypothetical protein